MKFFQDTDKLEHVDPRWKKYVQEQYDNSVICDRHEHMLRSRDVEVINQEILKKRRVVVSLGCSFTEGQAAFSQDLVDKLRPRGGNGSNFDYVGKGHDIDDMLELASEYSLPLQVINDSIWNNTTSNLSVFTKAMEINNAFVNKFCEVLDNDYVPVNLGNNGNGNIAAINRLFQYPIDWHLCEDIIVLWCHSDQHRFDFINDDCVSFSEIGGDHTCMWPKYDEYNPDIEKFHAGTAWHNTQWYFTKTIRSDSFSYLNHMDQGIKLDTWCKANNAKLMIFGAFSNVNRSDIEDQIFYNNVVRDHNRIQFEDPPRYSPSTHEIFNTGRYLDKFPWQDVVKPQGHDTFLQLALAQEKNPAFMDLNMWQIIEQGGTPNDWIFPCGHPSGKAHLLLAKELVDIATHRGIL